MRILLALGVLSLSACAATPRGGPSPVAPAADWRAVATASDRERLRDWRTAFTKALEQARKAGHAAEIEREGALLEPDAALGPAPIPNGDYKCRVIKVGAKSEGLLDYIAYPAFDCRIAQQQRLQSFTKLTGSQKTKGRFFTDSDFRQTYLGTFAVNDDPFPTYGKGAETDQTGYAFLMSPTSWRIEFPAPYYESKLDILEFRR